MGLSISPANEKIFLINNVSMIKIYVFLALFLSYVGYSAFVYTSGTESNIAFTKPVSESIDHGRLLFQKYNCISCHQLYGLGGYLGPELTTSWSDPKVGEQIMRTFLQYGGTRMPNFHFTAKEIDDILSFLKYVDSTAVTYKQ